MGTEMGVAVLLKLVPDTTAKITVSGDRVDEASIGKWATSPYDEYALECAIQLRESGYGEIVAITCGKAESSKVLTDAAAVGADSLIHIMVEDDKLDSIQIQSLLSAAVKYSKSEVVVCGKQAADTNSGSTGPGIASLLGFSCVGSVSTISQNGESFLASRLGISGNEEVEVSAPCVFTFDKGETELRRPNVRGIMMAKKKPIEVLSASDLGVVIGESGVTIQAHSSPPEKSPGQIFQGAASVPEVVGKLRDEANVI
ncbi:MAG: hypothetical protein CMB61_02965 [Euryarchaeota archaeon]|nr:hypothetical protein [Euryarchaeota archaeon]|tara:strand:- start:178 stop:948 length:771 start_codon:yes stop_codon:yes gene_type:complete